MDDERVVQVDMDLHQKIHLIKSNYKSALNIQGSICVNLEGHKFINVSLEIYIYIFFSL